MQDNQSDTQNISSEDFARLRIRVPTPDSPQSRQPSPINPSFIGTDVLSDPVEEARKKRAEEQALLNRAHAYFGRATRDLQSAQGIAQFDENDWRVQPAEFYQYHDSEFKRYGRF